MDKSQKFNNEKKTHGLKYINIMCVYYKYIWKRGERVGQKRAFLGISFTLENAKLNLVKNIICNPSRTKV